MARDGRLHSERMPSGDIGTRVLLRQGQVVSRALTAPGVCPSSGVDEKKSAAMSKPGLPAASWVATHNKKGSFMAFQTTALYALPLAFGGLVLWFRVTSLRAALKVSIGDAGDPGLHERIRQHGNFIEWAPMVLVLMLLAEGNGADAWWLHAAGSLLLAGRLIHPFGLKAGNPGHPLRYVGNSASLLAMVIAMAALGVTLFRL